LGVHSVRAIAPAWRDAMVARLGEGPWKGLYSLIALAGLILLIWGYGQARPDAPVFYEPPIWMRHIVILLMWVAMILLVAAYVPAGHIKKRIKHPMITAVKVWALAHCSPMATSRRLFFALPFSAGRFSCALPRSGGAILSSRASR
jgi:uncharacterized membrane protein